MGGASTKWLKDLDLSKPIDMGFTERVFAEFDTDHNGVLDKEETLIFVRKWCTYHGVGDSVQHGIRFQEFWDKFAVDGVITKEILMGTKDRSMQGSSSMTASRGSTEDKSRQSSSPPAVSRASLVQNLMPATFVQQASSVGYSPNFQDPSMYSTAVSPISLYIKTLATRSETGAATASVVHTYQFPSTPVKDLMQLIVDVFKIPLDHQTLICEGNLLEPDKTLESYKLQNDDVIVLADQIPFVKEVTSVGQVKQHLDNGGSLGGDREAGCLVWSDRKKEHYHIFWETASGVWCAKAQPPLTHLEREAALARSTAPSNKQLSLLYPNHNEYVPRSNSNNHHNSTTTSNNNNTSSSNNGAAQNGRIYQPKAQSEVQGPDPSSPGSPSRPSSQPVGPSRTFPPGTSLSTKTSPPSSRSTTSTTSNHMSPAPQEDIHWRRGVEIGSGSFGKVYQAQNVKTGELMAVKQVKIKMDSEEQKAQVQQLEREIAAMALLTHPNIVQMISTEIKQDKINILMEYVPGASLAAQLKQFGPFEEAHARKYTKQLLEALAYCHAAGIVHRDIKGGNILVSLQGSPKLADFGSAKRFADVNADSHLSVGYCYTTEWTAPEVFAHGSYNSKVDIWSVGCVVIEMMTGKLPWAEQKFTTRERAMFFIGSSTDIPAIPKKLSAQGQDFLLRCLNRDPNKRASAVELLEHDWIKEAA